jgi:hypothetical protein
VREAKFEEKRGQIAAMVARLKNEAAAKIKTMGVDTEKTKKIVENSVFIQQLNGMMEALHQQLFTQYYKHQLLYLHFVVQNPLFKAAREFENQYLECLSVEKVSNKFNKEWRDRLVKEMLRFNGKTPTTGFDGSESVSDNTSEGIKSQKALQQRPKSALKGASGAPPQQQNTPGGGQVKFNNQQRDEVDDAIAMLNPAAAGKQRKDSGDSINFRETSGFEGGGSHRRNDSGSFI